MDKEDYFGKLDSIINDSSKFERINVTESKQHPVITKEASISYYVRKYFKSYGKNVIDQLIPSGSSPGKLYGRIKIHKKGNPAWPVVSMINTPEYNLAKFLDNSGVRRIFQWGGLVTSHCNDVKILRYNYSSLEVLKCIVL